VLYLFYALIRSEKF
ncbi:potassium-transporting ATPase subunit F, partial [Staphylococcus aureus]